MIDLDKFWKSSQLPTMPSVAVKLLELSRDPDSEVSDIIGAVKADPALSAKILKSTNSSYFGFSSKITSIDRAVPLLGRTVVTSLALSFSLSESAMSNGPMAEHYKSYWKQSVLQGVAAEIVGDLFGSDQRSDLFLAGLLMDLGRLAMLKTIPEEYLPVLTRPLESRENLYQAELRMLGVSHVEIGGQLMQNWNLPTQLVEAVKNHHATVDELQALENHPDFVWMKVLTTASCVGEFFSAHIKGPALQQFTRLSQELLQINDSQREELLRQVMVRIGEMGEIFSVDASELGEPADLLAQANEQLAQMTLLESVASTRAVAQQQVADQQKQELEINNQALKKQVLHDALTGIYNRQFFDETLKLELDNCRRVASTIGILFCDLDHFKQLNDTYGHPFGDYVLKRVASVMMEVLRTSDVVARYGGEEFVIAIKHPTEKGIGLIAERLRARIESEEIYDQETRVPITMSVGGVIALPRRDETQLGGRIVSAADEAMYESKRNGRNQVLIHSMLNEGEKTLIERTIRRRFSRWIVNKKVCDIPEVSSALLECHTNYCLIGELAQKHEYLTGPEVDRILNEQKKKNLRFGEAALQIGLLDGDQLAQLLALQQEDPQDTSAALVRLGLLDEQYTSALLKQYQEEVQKLTKSQNDTVTEMSSEKNRENSNTRQITSHPK